jgi:hypothetical protein
VYSPCVTNLTTPGSEQPYATGMTELAAGLAELGYEVISTGGSCKAIAEAGVEVTPVDQITDFPEMLDGGDGNQPACLLFRSLALFGFLAKG